MNILHVSTRTHIKYGGGEKFLEQFLDNFSNDEHVFIGKDEVVEAIFRERDLITKSFPGGYEPISLRKKLFIPLSFLLGIATLIRYYKFFHKADVIISSTSSIGPVIFIFPWLKLFSKKRLMTFMHSNCIDYYVNQPLYFLLKLVWEHTETVFVSYSQLETWQNKGLATKNSCVIYNGTKTEIINFTPDKKVTNTLKIGYIGRLYWQKGLQDLINSLIFIPNEISVELLIAGEGEEREKIVKLIHSVTKNRPNLKIRLLGFISDFNNFYKKIDLLVHPSYIESFGLVLIESWLHGTPTLTSNLNSFLEIKSKINNLWENKLVFEAKNVHKLCQKLIFFHENKAQILDQLNLNNLINRTQNNFSIDKMNKSYSDLIYKVDNK